MIINQVIYDCKTGETRIEQVEIDETNEPVQPQEPTLEERINKLEKSDIELIATSWDMDFRICEIEWTIEDSLDKPINLNRLRKDMNNMALTRFEQAKIIILGGAYNRVTLEKQLVTYLKRGYLTQEEYDTLISMMDAKEMVSEEII